MDVRVVRERRTGDPVAKKSRAKRGGPPKKGGDHKPRSPNERLKSVIGKAKGLPADASRDIDHYLYGAPKR